MANDATVYKRNADIYTSFNPKTLNMLLQLTILITTIVVVLVPGIFYLLTLQKTLTIISPLSRMMRPQQVWLMLIPLFNIVWHFIMVSRLSDSIKNECVRLHIPLQETNPAYILGVGSMCFYLAAIILNITQLIPLLVPLLHLGGFIVWILYWIKISKYKNLILASQNNFLFDAEREAAGIAEHN